MNTSNQLISFVVWLSAAVLIVAFSAVTIVGCGASDSDGTGAFPGAASDGNSGFDGGTGSDGADATDSTDGFIPEDEQELLLQAPQGGGQYVFVVSTALDAVVRIDGLTLSVDLIEVGGEPITMRTLGGEDALLVYNRGTQDFSVVRFTDGAEPTVDTLDASERLNRLEVSKSGRYAVAFFDVNRAPIWEPLGDLQLALVLDLDPTSTSVTPVGVGFAPEAAVFTEDESELLVVTESGVSIIDLSKLGEPQFAPQVDLGTIDPDAPDREVLITPTGSHAVLRVGADPDVRVIRLSDGNTEIVTLSAAPTDIDIMPNGTDVLAVVREAQTVARWSVEDTATVNIITLTDTPAGVATVNAAAGQVLLHTSQPDEEWLAVLDLETEAVVRHELKKGVNSVAASPDGKRVLVLHDRLEEAVLQSDDLETRIDKSWAYSILDVDSGFVKLVLLDSEPSSFLVTPDSAHAYVLVPDETGSGYHAADEISLTSLQVRTHALGSPPEHLIEIPTANRIAVSQNHPVGRITFISTESSTTETVTGFELNSLIE
jgi:DNA-binding beta-propeller fold protein YncE